MKKLFDKFGKKKVYATGIVVSVVIVATIIVFAMTHINPLALKQDTFVTEYGKTVSTNAKDYLKTEDKSVLEKAKVSIEKLENEKDKEYTKIGNYKAVIKYNKKSVEFNVEVKDTIAPKFKDLAKKIVVEQNAVDVDFAKYFEAEDLSEFKISVDSKKVDLKNTGDYEIKVTAKDKYDNETTKVVEVKVVSMEEAEKENVVTKTLDGTVYQSEALKNKVIEEEKKEEAEATNGGVANNGGNTSNGGSTSGGNTGNSGSTSGGNTSNGGGQPTQPSKPNVCVPDGNFGRLGNSGKVFYSKGEADRYGENYIMGQGETWTYSGWYAWTVFDNCGERSDVWTVDFY